MNDTPPRRVGAPILLTALVATAALAVTALLVSIFQRQQEARSPFYRVVELNDDTVDP
jgi:nitrite reductase (cytochrome c-552)